MKRVKYARARSDLLVDIDGEHKYNSAPREQCATPEESYYMPIANSLLIFRLDKVAERFQYA